MVGALEVVGGEQCPSKSEGPRRALAHHHRPCCQPGAGCSRQLGLVPGTWGWEEGCPGARCWQSTQPRDSTRAKGTVSSGASSCKGHDTSGHQAPASISSLSRVRLSKLCRALTPPEPRMVCVSRTPHALAPALVFATFPCLSPPCITGSFMARSLMPGPASPPAAHMCPGNTLSAARPRCSPMSAPGATSRNTTRSGVHAAKTPEIK